MLFGLHFAGAIQSTTVAVCPGFLSYRVAWDPTFLRGSVFRLAGQKTWPDPRKVDLDAPDTPQRGCLCRVPGRLWVLCEQWDVHAVPSGPVPAEREMPPRLPRGLWAHWQTHRVHTPRSVWAKGRSEATKASVTDMLKCFIVSLNLVHCEVGEWGEWSPCSRSGRTCGFKRGQETRTRQVLRYPSPFGNPCPEISEIKECLVKRRKCQGKAKCVPGETTTPSAVAHDPPQIDANSDTWHGVPVAMNSRPRCFSLSNQSCWFFRSGLWLFTQRIVIVVRARTAGGTRMCDVAMGMLCVFPRDLLGLSNRKTGFLLRAKRG